MRPDSDISFKRFRSGLFYTNSHKIESSHQQDHVDQKQPVSLQRNTTLGDKCTGKTALLLADSLSCTEGIGFGQAKSEEDDENWRTSSKPEKGSPAVRGGVYEATCECSREEITKCVSLLKHSRDDTTSCLGAILQSCGRRITIKSTHGNTEQRADSQELLECLTEAGAQLKDNEEQIVDDEGPDSDC